MATLTLHGAHAAVQSKALVVRGNSDRSVGFNLMAPKTTGLAFTNRLSDTAAVGNRILENGSGVAAGDIDGDGRTDLYFCRLEGPNVLYRNLGGWRFEKLDSNEAIHCANQYSTGAALVDLDGDRDLDLLVNGIGNGTRCFINDGRGRFSERSNAGLLNELGATSIAVADIDMDGDLDLYVTNYRTTTVKDETLSIPMKRVDGLWQLPPEHRDRFISTRNLSGRGILLEQGEADILYLNDGRGRFDAVNWTQGFFRDEAGQALKEPPLDWSLSAMFGDLNGDSYPDLYVCSDFITPDRIWLNRQGTGFQAISRAALSVTSWSSMSVDFSDVNADGHTDVFVADMLSPDHVKRNFQRVNVNANTWTDWSFGQRSQFMRNTLFLNRGNGTFFEAAQYSGLQATDWTWSSIFLDVDLDGLDDLLIANGHPHDSQDSDGATAIFKMTEGSRNRQVRNRARLTLPPLRTPNYLFRNRGNLEFEEIGADWGFHSTAFSQAMALADLDNDGDLDVVMNCLQSPAELYQNEAVAPRIAVSLRGKPPNTAAIGAKVKLIGGSPQATRELRAGGRYLSSDQPLIVFAAGDDTDELMLEVQWPDRTTSLLKNVEANRRYEIQQPSEGEPIEPKPAIVHQRPLFEDVSNLIEHRHQDRPYDDFQLQPLMTRQFSKLGPCVAWLDANRDGWEDLAIGAGTGSTLSLYQNRGGTSFEQNAFRADSPQASSDQTSILAIPSPAGAPKVLVGLSNYESQDSHPAVQVIEISDADQPSLPFEASDPRDLAAWASSVGPMSLGDIDRDGDLDLFVGGRIVPGRYPSPAESRIFLNEAGQFNFNQRWSENLGTIGLVSGSVFSDLDGDGWLDLALACEWGPIRVLLNRQREFVDETAKRGIDGITGWWNSITAGDFNGDGRMDLVAGNWGRNTKYQINLQQPIFIVFGTVYQRFLAIEGYQNLASNQHVPWWDRDNLGQALPWIRTQFPTYRAFGSASLEEILGDHWQSMQSLQAQTFESMIFLNRTDSFEPMPLPVESQMAPCFGISVADFNGDGREDLVVSQNFYGTELETSPYDAGRGLVLLGNGDGEFKSLTIQEAGVEMYGEGRGSAVADFDHDGRADIAMGRHGRGTKLYRNLEAEPGIRVRLLGPPGNPEAIGAKVRFVAGGVQGPVRELHAGSGYWSLDSAVQVLQPLPSTNSIWVQWPDGHETTSEDAPRTKAIEMRWDSEK